MEIAIINPSLRPDSKRRQLPVGIAYIMMAIKKAGFDFDFIDMDINNYSMKDLEGFLSSKKYDIIAIGCIVTGFKIVKQIAEVAKKTNPDSHVIAGNSVATAIPEILLRETMVDIAVLGEGDITIVELLKAIEQKKNLHDVAGIAFSLNNKTEYSSDRPVISDINLLDFPDWEMFDLKKYRQYGHVNANVFSAEDVVAFPLNSARGCPFDCTFCYHCFKKAKYRRCSAEKILEEIKRLHHSYSCSHISFWDELTIPTIKSAEKLVDSLRSLDFKITFEANTIGKVFKKEHVDIVKALKEVGCDNIGASLENGSPEILSAMNKKISVSQFCEQAKTLWKGGIVPVTSVIFGYPQETPDTIQKTIDICRECNIFPSVGFLLPMPGTEIYDWALKNRKIVDEVQYLMRIGDRQDFHINLTSMTDEEFVDTVTEKLEALADNFGLSLPSVFKTVTRQKPKNEIKTSGKTESLD